MPKEKKEKKERKGKKDTTKRSKSAKAPKTSENDAPHGAVGAPAAQADPAASPDFEAGLLFERYANSGGVEAKDFQRMWRELATRQAEQASQPSGGGLAPDLTFEAGQLFQRYNHGSDGKLTRADFERMVGNEVRRRQQAAQDTAVPAADRPVAGSAGGGDIGGPKPEASGAGTYAPPVGPPISHYNETTGVPLPSEAVASQLSLGHTVVLINEAYNRRLARLQALTSSRLMPVREQLLQLRRRLHNCAEEVQSARAAIERETMADAKAIVERLRSAEALKQASVDQRVEEVTAELNAIDKITEKVAGVSALSDTNGFCSPATRYTHEFETMAKMVELIQSYSELCASIDRAANRPVDTSIDVRSDDYPHETAERLEVLCRADSYEKALAVKDHMLWTVLQESLALDKQCQEEQRLGNEYAEEAAEWVALTGTLSGEVAALKREASLVPALRKENSLLASENQQLANRVKQLEAAAATAAAAAAAGQSQGLPLPVAPQGG